MLRGITTARYSMQATLIRPTQNAPENNTDPATMGQWTEEQDPLTGEVIRVWKPVYVDDPGTAQNDVNTENIWCMARGIIDGGIRAAATTESFDDIYRNVDIINIWVPKKYRITKRDRITNIRSKSGLVLWRDEEFEGTGEVRATMFNVNGVVPVFDPFNRHIDNFCLLERAEV